MLPPPIEHLRDAINSHDPARVADCFTENYQAIFARLPDLRATVLRSCHDDSGCWWSEWEMSGTSREGVPSVSTGVVIILSVVDQRIEHTRFYLDAVS